MIDKNIKLKAKSWNWAINTESIWLEPSPDSYYISNKWKKSGYTDLLDFGCGLGRHAIFFAKENFNVKAFDLSDAGIEHLKRWANDAVLDIDITVSDMHALPYADNSFDCIFAYHVISHTNTDGIGKIIKEIERVLRTAGEIYFTLCSKETWSFNQDEAVRADRNTIIKKGGIEDGIPHFYVELDDIFKLFQNFEIEQIRHIDDCFIDGRIQKSKHYFVLARKKLSS